MYPDIYITDPGPVALKKDVVTLQAEFHIKVPPP
jgi:hypothetical protein